MFLDQNLIVRLLHLPFGFMLAIRLYFKHLELFDCSSHPAPAVQSRNSANYGRAVGLTTEAVVARCAGESRL